MKKMILMATLLTAAFSTPYFQTAKTANAAVRNIEAISIEMSGDVLVAKSDNPSDPLTLLQVYNRAFQLVAQTNCGSIKCTLDLSSLAPGLYVAKAYTANTHASQSIYVN